MTRLKIWLIGASSLLLIALDQWVKHWATQNLQPRGINDRAFIPGFLRLTYVENPGAAFGFLSGFDWARWFFIIFTFIVLAGLLYYYARLPLDKKFLAIRIPLVLIFAGAVGNLIDRMRQGFVVDMFEFEFINFPIFNVADILLVVGCIVAGFVILFIIKDIP